MRNKIVQSILLIICVSMLSGCSASDIPGIGKLFEKEEPVEEQVEEQPTVNITANVGQVIKQEHAIQLVQQQLAAEGTEGTVNQLFMTCEDTGEVNTDSITVIEGIHKVSVMFNLVEDNSTLESSFYYEGLVDPNAPAEGQKEQEENTEEQEVVYDGQSAILQSDVSRKITLENLIDTYNEDKQQGLIESGTIYQLDGTTVEDDVEKLMMFEKNVDTASKTYSNVVFSSDYTEEEEVAWLNDPAHAGLSAVLDISVSEINSESYPHMALITLASNKIDVGHNVYLMFLQGMESTLDLEEPLYKEAEEADKKEKTEETPEEESSEEGSSEEENTVNQPVGFSSMADIIGSNTSNFETLWTIDWSGDTVYLQKDNDEVSSTTVSADELAELKLDKTINKTYKAAHPNLYVWPELSSEYTRWDWRITDVTSIIGTITLADGSIIPAEQTSGEEGYSYDFTNGGSANMTNRANQNNQSEVPAETVYTLSAGADKIILKDATESNLTLDTSSVTDTTAQFKNYSDYYLVQTVTSESFEAQKSVVLYDGMPDTFDLTSESSTGANGYMITVYNAKFVDAEGTMKNIPYFAAIKINSKYYVICYCPDKMQAQYSTHLFDILSLCIKE